jgi:hypothetical protein
MVPAPTAITNGINALAKRSELFELIRVMGGELWKRRKVQFFEDNEVSEGSYEVVEDRRVNSFVILISGKPVYERRKARRRFSLTRWLKPS